MKKKLLSCAGNRSRRNRQRQVLVSILMLTTCFYLHAQVSFAGNQQYMQAGVPQKQDPRVTIKVRNEKLSTVLSKIEKQIPQVFVYSDDDVNSSQRISLDVKNEPLPTILEAISNMANVNAEFINDKIILRSKTGKSPDFNTTPLYSLIKDQQPEYAVRADITVTGRLTDEEGNPIPSASVTVKGTSIGTTTNANGNFALTIPDNISNPVLVFSIVGFEIS